ncbi:MAG: phosphoglycolate phosphatase [Pseudomonadota bacterium]
MALSAMRAVVFDLDGTLVHSAPDIHAAANAVLAEIGRPPLSLDQVCGFIGNGVVKLIERALAATGGVRDLDTAVARFRAIYGAAPARLTQPYEGVRACLSALRRADLALAVCTNKPEAPARAILQALDLSAPFPVVVGGDTVGVAKPDPAPLLACLGALGVGVGDTLFVGDSETDEDTAQRAGVAFAHFTRGYRNKPADAFRAAFAFDDYAALAPFVLGGAPAIAVG